MHCVHKSVRSISAYAANSIHITHKNPMFHICCNGSSNSSTNLALSMVYLPELMHKVDANTIPILIHE